MFYIRTDANGVIASGHVMRCISIARELSRKKQQITFLISDEISKSILPGGEFQSIVLNTTWKNLLPEISTVKALLKKGDSLLIDTYSICEEYVKELCHYANVYYLGSKRIPLGPLKALINYSTDIDEQFYLKHYNPSKTKLLLGPWYAPIREEFCHQKYKIANKVRRVLITAGGAPSLTFLERLLEKLLIADTNGIDNFDVVVGRLPRNKEGLYKKYSSSTKICFLENVQTMGQIMAQCDLAISANGTTVYELAAVGVPTITFAMVKEQTRSAEKLASMGATYYVGSSYDNMDACVEALVDATQLLCENLEVRIKLAKRAHELIDGNGCERLVEVLLAF